MRIQAVLIGQMLVLEDFELALANRLAQSPQHRLRVSGRAPPAVPLAQAQGFLGWKHRRDFRLVIADWRLQFNRAFFSKKTGTGPLESQVLSPFFSRLIVLVSSDDF